MYFTTMLHSKCSIHFIKFENVVLVQYDSKIVHLYKAMSLYTTGGTGLHSGFWANMCDFKSWHCCFLDWRRPGAKRLTSLNHSFWSRLNSGLWFSSSYTFFSKFFKSLHTENVHYVAFAWVNLVSGGDLSPGDWRGWSLVHLNCSSLVS